MINLLPSLVAQFGGFEPVSPLTPDVRTDPNVASHAENIVSLALGIITTIGGLFLIINFLIAGLNWITSHGDSGKLKKARDTMIQSVIGLIILILAYMFIAIIGTIIGFDILDLQTQVQLLTPGGATP